MRRLGRHPDGQLAADFIKRGHAAAGLDGRDMDAREVHMFFDYHLGLIKELIGARLVAALPMPDMVGLLVRVVWADQRRIWLQRLVGIDHRRQRLISTSTSATPSAAI